MTNIRFFHAIPNAPNVDIYLNEDLVVEGLTYSKFTPYLPVKPGDYTVEINKAGTGQLILKSDITIPDNQIYTMAIIGTPSDPSLIAIEDPRIPIPKGKVAVRFGHLSPNAPAVDVRVADGPIVFEDVSYKTVTDYVEIDPGKYTFEVTPAGTDKVVLIVPNINFKGNRFYSVYAIGLINMEPPLQVVIPLDGNSYL